MRRHHDLDVWRESRRLVKRVYLLTATFPADERFGLTAQIRRAAVSIPSNIAEGAARSTRRDFANFVRIARGSLSELETQILLARDLGLCSPDSELDGELERLFAKLNNLLRVLTREPFR
ncbi:four helix bundle protein [Salinisphaera sp. PC39]|uniref:four helix bundle protein n=1 Tax=Salinisphaera sp. PC39 TaxID=1304156 RepID=UPI0033423EBD